MLVDFQLYSTFEFPSQMTIGEAIRLIVLQLSNDKLIPLEISSKNLQNIGLWTPATYKDGSFCLDEDKSFAYYQLGEYVSSYSGSNC